MLFSIPDFPCRLGLQLSIHTCTDVIYFFLRQVLVVSGPKEMQTVLVTKGADFSGRPVTYRTDVFNEQGKDMAFCQPTTSWKKLRKTCHSAIKQYDKGLDRIEEYALRVMHGVLKDFVDYKGTPFDPMTHLHLLAMNNITLFLTGQTVKADSEMFKLNVETEDVGLDLVSPVSEGAILDLFPWLRFVNRRLADSAIRYRPLRNKLCELLRKENAKAECDGFNGSLISVLNKAVEASDELSPVNVDLATANMILGGTSTTTNFLYCFLNIMIHYPEVQERLYHEIEDVIGSRTVSLSDRNNMPLSQAALF